MKKQFFVALSMFPLVVTAESIESSGLPLPDGGIKVLPFKKIATSEAPTNPILIAQKQIREKGFYETTSAEPKVIMNMRNIKPLPVGSNNYQDTNVKSAIVDVGLAFQYNGVPIDPVNIIGYTASGSYNNGWTGVTEIFTDKVLGTCQYALNYIKLSHGSEFIPQEVARSDVNGKITTLDVRGDTNSGYIYSIHWADSDSMNDLQCASMTYDKKITQALIMLAKNIDKSTVSKLVPQPGEK